MTEQSNLSTDGGESKGKHQRLLPLFVIALALMGVGFYLALEPQDDVDVAGGERPVLSDMRPLEIADEAVDAEVAPVELVLAPFESRPVELTLRQKSRREGAGDDTGVMQTVIELGLHEEVDAAEEGRFDQKGVLAIDRSYDRAQAEVTAGDGQTIGTGITSQVEELLRGSVTRMFVTKHGEPVDFEWREVPNPQARRMLYLVRDAQTFLTPRFFNGDVNPGDTWSYKRPMMVEEPKAGVSAEGEVTIDNRFVGVIEDGERRIGVVRQTLRASAEGKLDADEAKADFSLEGEGAGVVLVAIGEGKTLAADIDLERKLTVDAGDEPVVYTSEIFLGLRPEGGLTLPELRKQQDEESHELEASKDHAEAE
ncbi:hypothetical protein FIV42_03525 [Persicimonas caeni]|uniref:DUF4340 domain-containing protein n=1 Tax=Persicimonas caeni TaxID=2292766 RepID=A0A4Y6PNG2_PERCE|nr:hypothetical protein [Persicimonas caeni]QDG49841.1 hypothetical protein FIV42_03525 [Persicimonas caeni]QED31062.1 hypothetical protein FRD00_03520 [Persicimonas caeni]